MTELEAKLLAEVGTLNKTVADLSKTVVDLTAELAKLRARLGQDSSNSSRPSSTDAPWKPKRKPPQGPTGRKPGGQAGHPPHTRKMLPPDEVFEALAGECPHCKKVLDESTVVADEDEWVHQVVELVAQPVVREYRMLCHQCPCGKKVRAPLPAGVPPTASGPKLQAAITTLMARFHLSREDVQEALAQLFGITLSVGAIHEVGDRAAQASRPAVQDIAAQLEAATNKHCDETGWRHDGERAWLWVLCNATAAYFRVDPRRNRDAFRSLLPSLTGLIHTDRWRVYDIIVAKMRQLCHAHLRRDIQALIDLGGTVGELGKKLLAASDEMFHHWHAFERGELDREGLLAAMSPVQATWLVLCQEARTHEHKKARALGKDLIQQWDSLWAFLDHDGAEPTNNRAEREVRPGVLLRKTNGGTSSELGAEFVGNIQSIIATAKLQRIPVCAWLERMFMAWWQPVALPLLLPRPVT